ncbi:PH domain-containing protein [Actinoplanes awajinensis]|uniref:Chemotaxis protein CheW n=1 Tax=Actinoplanes awajinensis subsp. mycoplanecinus TaxID=135947 RepID=A0A0X3V740_9ACTN|nr:PH domain-containing protein [Actinoplanes awajinensis]KUL40623.1 chemotaxis protein CheW [Actinoplanes awajinensis subsp. mycoplanecinus]
MSRRPTVRVRQSGTALVAAGIAFVGTVPFAGGTPALAPLLLIPLAVLAWAWRAGTDVFPDELVVRALIGGSRVPWDRITELAPDRRGRVSALLDNGNTIRLTGITRDNLHLVLAAAGKSATADDDADVEPEPATAEQ